MERAPVGSTERHQAASPALPAQRIAHLSAPEDCCPVEFQSRSCLSWVSRVIPNIHVCPVYPKSGRSGSVCAHVERNWRVSAWPSFNHLVGAGKQRVRDRDPKRLGGPEIDDCDQFRRLLDRQIRSFLRLARTHCLRASQHSLRRSLRLFPADDR
jgi:hypothetical protein